MSVVRSENRIQLVGGQAVLADTCGAQAIESFYGGLFGRLANDVPNTGVLTRFMTYQSPMGGNEYLYFFGIEVESIDEIPDGMLSWELSAGERTVISSDSSASTEKIEWLWLDQSSGRRLTGEFVACGREHWMSLNSYFKPKGKGDNDEIILVDYDPAWPLEFERMADWVRESFGPEIALRVEHYGSTSIPDMPAKPVVDILVEIPSFHEAKRRLIPLLNSEEWEYCWYSGHMIFIKRDRLMGTRTHHIHAAPSGHPVWRGLAFRDYLRSHAGDASRYAELKRELASSCGKSRERYTEAKSEFVQAITSRALDSA